MIVCTILQIIILMCSYNNLILLKLILIMIQRVQSIYLTLVVLINISYLVYVEFFSSFHFPLNSILLSSNLSIFLYLIPTLVISVISLFSYKKRNRQLILNKLNLMCQFIFLFILIYNQIKFGIFYILLILNITLIIVANNGIKSDENLIKSLNRFR